MPFFSSALTVTTTAQALMTNRPLIQKVRQIAVAVQSMGTATYIKIGGTDSQDKKFVTVGDGISISAIGIQKYIDISSIRVISDTSDGVIEIFGDADV